jgi:hypothetical protein
MLFALGLALCVCSASLPLVVVCFVDCSALRIALLLVNIASYLFKYNDSFAQRLGAISHRSEFIIIYSRDVSRSRHVQLGMLYCAPVVKM